MKTAAEGELIFVEKFTCKRFELDLYHPVGQLAADASGLFLWSRRPEVFTESHARRCHYDTTRFAHSLSLSVCIFMISYDRYDFTLYCVRHIHVVIIYIYIHTLYIGFLENNGSRNRKIPIWIHLAFQAFVRDTSEFSLLISSPVQCPNLTWATRCTARCLFWGCCQIPQRSSKHFIYLPIYRVTQGYKVRAAV